MKNCSNHPDRKALSVCHGCGRSFCELCLDEGKEFYFCKDPRCQALLKKESVDASLPLKVVCPNCASELELSDRERTSKKFHCPECESFIDFTVDPPKILDTKNYFLLLKTMNQADAVIIKSLLGNSDIDYYVFDEDFFTVRPLVQPVRFFVEDSQMDEAKELLKDFELKVYGLSSRNGVEE